MEDGPMASSTSAPGPDAAGDASSSAAGNGGGGGREAEVCEQAKLFVGGIPWDATEEALRGYFGKYGEVVDAVIMKDRETGNARGFGFVSFADPSAADRAIRDDTAKHAILGRPVEVRRAIPRGAQHHNQHHQYSSDYQHQSRVFCKSSGRTMDGGQTTSKKIFVGGLSANVTQEDFKRYFERFGKITDVVVMYDSATNRPRGFGFITFDAEESVENAVKNAFHTLNGKTVEVKRAVPRDGSDNTNSYYNRNNENGSNNSRMGNGKGSNLNSYPRGIYPPYSPRFGAFQGYGTHPYAPYTYGVGYGGGGLAFGGHGISYGAPYTAPWNTWNGRGFVDIRQSPVPYGAVGFYPGCYNGGINPYVGIGVGGYHGSANGKRHQDDNDSHAQVVKERELGPEQGQIVPFALPSPPTMSEDLQCAMEQVEDAYKGKENVTEENGCLSKNEVKDILTKVEHFMETQACDTAMKIGVSSDGVDKGLKSSMLLIKRRWLADLARKAKADVAGKAISEES